MNSRDFCFWLQGYLEIGGVDKNKGAESLSREQVDCVKRHLDLVFVHEIDPSMGPKKHQDKLNQIHRPDLHPPEWSPPDGGGPLMRC